MSCRVFRPCYLYPDRAESELPDRATLKQANEDAAKLPKIPGAELVVSEYEREDDGGSIWQADYRLGEVKPCYTRND